MHTYGCSVTEDVVRISDAMLQLLRSRTRSALQAEIVRDVHAAVDPATYPVLVAVARFQPVSAAALTAELGLDRSVISRRASRLIAAGLLAVGSDAADRRTSLLTVTDAGRGVSLELDRHRTAAIARLVDHWSPRQRRELGELLERFVHELQALRPSSVAWTKEADPPL